MELQRRELRLVFLWTKRVDRLLVAGTVAAVIVIGGRLFAAGGSVSLFSIDDIPLNATWALFAVGTLLHAATGRFLVQHIKAIPHTDDLSEEAALYDNILAEAGWFVSVEVRRVGASDEVRRRPARMSTTDPSTWTAYGAAFVVWVALLPWWWDDGLHVAALPQLLVTALVAALVITLNWLIGGVWAVAISSLDEYEKQRYFPGVPDISAGEPAFAFGFLLSAFSVLTLLIVVVATGHAHLGL